jgi:hypothetical protein
VALQGFFKGAENKKMASLMQIKCPLLAARDTMWSQVAAIQPIGMVE